MFPNPRELQRGSQVGVLLSDKFLPRKAQNARSERENAHSMTNTYYIQWMWETVWHAVAKIKRPTGQGKLYGIHANMLLCMVLAQVRPAHRVLSVAFLMHGLGY